MIFHTFGDASKKPVLLIHGMLNPWQLWEEAAEHFSKECYVIVPELDAHTEEETSTFVSVDDEAKAIREYVINEFGGKLFMICGLSMGGRIAATIAGLPGISTEHLVLDGAPLMAMPKFLIRFMTNSYIKIIKKSKARDPKTLASCRRDFLPERYIDDFLKIADHIEDTSIRNILSSVFSAFDYKTYDPNCRILFMHGTKGNESVSRKAALKMKEVNPQTEIRVYDGYAHAQLMSFEQSKWIREVQGFLNKG